MADGIEIKDEIFTEEQLNALSSATGTNGGKFYDTLKQNAKQIKESQAAQLAEDLEFALRNEITLLKNNLRTVYRQRDSMIDQFLPSQTTALKFGENFNAEKFAKDRVNYGVQIRNFSIQLNIALAEYKDLIGKDFKG